MRAEIENLSTMLHDSIYRITWLFDSLCLGSCAGDTKRQQSNRTFFARDFPHWRNFAGKHRKSRREIRSTIWSDCSRWRSRICPRFLLTTELSFNNSTLISFGILFQWLSMLLGGTSPVFPLTIKKIVFRSCWHTGDLFATSSSVFSVSSSCLCKRTPISASCLSSLRRRLIGCVESQHWIRNDTCLTWCFPLWKQYSV